MFVYQNKKGNICITYSNMPVENPEYELEVRADGTISFLGDDAGDKSAVKDVQDLLDAANKTIELKDAEIQTLKDKIVELEASKTTEE